MASSQIEPSNREKNLKGLEKEIDNTNKRKRQKRDKKMR